MRWATILAGGSGTRLQSLTRVWTGDNRPKQFCPLLNGQTLLARTRRIARIVPPGRTVYAVTRDHRPYYRTELAEVYPARLVEQPGNLGTAAAIAYSMARIRREDRQALLGVFPADHYYENERRFSQALDATYRAALRHPDLVFLLATEPTSPEEEYGWIEPGRAIGTASRDTFAVTRFWEKPSRDLADGLMARGCLWNTFVMVGTRDSFRLSLHSAAGDGAALDLVESAARRSGSGRGHHASVTSASRATSDAARQPLPVVKLGMSGGPIWAAGESARFLAEHR